MKTTKVGTVKTVAVLVGTVLVALGLRYLLTVVGGIPATAIASVLLVGCIGAGVLLARSRRGGR